MKKGVILLVLYFIVVVNFSRADSIQDKIFRELDERLKKYDTVDLRNIEGVPTYILNLKGTDLDVIEAYLEEHKENNEFILYERADNGKWVKRVLKKIKFRYA